MNDSRSPLPSPTQTLPAPLRFVLLPLLAAFLLGGLAGCSAEKNNLEAIYKQSNSSRAAAAAALRAEFYSKSITVNAALNLAHDRLEKPGDANSLAYAVAVLSFLDQIEPDLDKAKLNDLFWTRVGTLAANTAAKAREGGDIPAARQLVLGGTSRWQTEAYWRFHPAHDALASLIMYENGEGQQALDRLRQRPELTEETQAAYTEIEKGMKKGGGKK